MTVYIHAAVRTAIGALGGSLRPLGVADLGAAVLRAALERSGLEPGRVAEVVLGCALQAGAGPNPARLAALRAGLPGAVPALTVNQGEGSGLRAVALAAQGLDAAGGFALAGGAESMSGVPYLLPAARWGARMGATRLLDGLLQDGLRCGHLDRPLAQAAEEAAARLGIGREAQDAHAAASHRRAGAAAAQGAFGREIVPVALPGGRREGSRVAGDACIRPETTAAGLARLAPVLGPEGTVTEGNGAPPADGAAVLLLGPEAGPGGRPPLARILGFAQAAVDPALPDLGAGPAIRRLLARTGLDFDRVDLWELDEGFAARSLAALAELPELDPARVNVRGGALALGHPLGASGARMLVTLLHLLEDRQARTGVVALGAGGGLSAALAIERV